MTPCSWKQQTVESVTCLNYRQLELAGSEDWPRLWSPAAAIVQELLPGMMRHAPDWLTLADTTTSRLQLGEKLAAQGTRTGACPARYLCLRTVSPTGPDC